MLGLLYPTSLLALIASASCAMGLAVEPSGDISFDTVYVQFGKNLGTTIPQRIRNHLSSSGVAVQDYIPGKSALTSASLVLSLGNAPLAETFVSADEVKSEGFQLMATKYVSDSTLMACNGAPINATGYSYALDVNAVHYGAAVCAYAALEKLGYAFLHPLEPLAPTGLRLKGAEAKALRVTEEPYWSKRTWHIHTMHPLEFTEVLNGFDAPMFTKDPSKCPKLAEHCESWDSMYDTLPGLFEWLVANRQNRVEVLLLGTQKWDMYNDLSSGTVRQTRLRSINRLAHEFGVLIGADIPIAFMQQHGWAMVSVRDPVEKQEADIRARVDWAFQAEYDFISTESGLSEFTKPSCDLMLQLFNIFTDHITNVWKRETSVKVHCSSNEFCEEKDAVTGKYKYPDPRYPEKDEPINFNLLPTYADPALGVMPHTVQVYSFDDPAANVYGNNNFSYMSDYMLYEASLKRRDVLYYAETAYWVNVDVDVPIFLPLSGQRRLYDLRRTARLEAEGGYKISGQMNFESGWEFGYYLSNAVTARAVWNPHMEVAGDWEAFRTILGPLMRAFGDLAAPLEQAIVNLAKTQADVMIYSKINGEDMDVADLKKLSGHAYMSGSDSWVDLPRLLGISFTQPDKVHADEPEDAQFGQATAVIAELHRVFKIAEAEFAAILSKAEGSLGQLHVKYIRELADCVSLLRLRAAHMHTLYQASSTPAEDPRRSALLLAGRDQLREAQEVMDARMAALRVPEARIAGWRQNPTVYPYGYIWAAKSLYYWWREQGILESRSAMSVSPCYLNRQEPLELVFGWGKVAEELIRLRLKKKGHDIENATAAAMLADCIAPPLHEIKFPRDL